MNTTQNRLSWLSNSGMTQKRIAEELGVNQSTVSRWLQGEMLPATGNANQIRNLYQRTVYNELRKQGYSREEARKLEWQAPKRAIIAIPSISGILNEIIDSRSRIEFGRLTRQGKDYDPLAIRKKVQGWIEDSIAEKGYTTDELRERYGKGKGYSA